MIKSVWKHYKILVILIVLIQTGDFKENKEKVEKLEKLILTEFIKTGKIEEARKLSKVENLSPILSYSGFLTVDQSCNSNLFFWFFPAAYAKENSPLILWHGGGPGTSGLFGLFVENGPFYVDDLRHLHLRETAWTLNTSVLYLDSPVGSGFSESDSPSCYVESAADAGKAVYEALTQFYKLFPEFDKNEFFIFSGSYGGKFAPAIAYEIHHQNMKLSSTKIDANIINLKGISITSGFTDPLHQIDYSEFYYNIGLIDKHERDYFEWQETIAKGFILKGQWIEAFNVIEPLIIGTDYSSRLKNVTGLNFPYNYLSNDGIDPPYMKNHIPFLNRRDVRQALHIDMSKKFSNSNDGVYNKLKEDIYKSVKPLVEELLDTGLYRICIASAQLDLIVPHTTVSKFVGTLNWRGLEAKYEFRKADTKILRGSAGDVAGYFKTAAGLTYILIRNAGHIWIRDQPQNSLEIMTLFTRGLLV